MVQGPAGEMSRPKNFASNDWPVVMCQFKWLLAGGFIISTKWVGMFE
jgi:hypothetical protein